MSIYLMDKYAKPMEDKYFDIENYDPSLNGENAHSLANEYRLNIKDFNRLFFSKYNITYLSEYFSKNNLELCVVTHPSESNTCFEKAELLNSCNPLNVIKTLYFENSTDNLLYAIVIPETGCFINRDGVKETLNLSEESSLKKSQTLPKYMSFGTCSPFITQNDISPNGSNVKKIVFDSETLQIKRDENLLDDFSFGDDHRLSLQMNYYHCFNMLKDLFPDIVVEKEILKLSFKEKFVRTNGKVLINCEFSSINYNTAKFINTINQFGDVTIINDYIDEIDLPYILKRFSKKEEETA